MLPVTPTLVSDDSLHFFGFAAGAGGNGLEVFEESATTGFGNPRVLEAAAQPVVTPAVTRSRGEVGVVWEKQDEVWGTVF